MNELWLDIKAWTKGLILAALIIYACLYIWNNNETNVKFWYWFKHEHSTNVFVLTSGAFASGIIFTILLNTALKTLRQIRDLRGRSRQDKIERDLQEMKAKAAMLQTRPVPSADVSRDP